MLSPTLVAKGVTFAAADDSGHCFFWSRCPLEVISDSGRYFEMDFFMGPDHVVKDSSLIVWSRVRLVC